MKTVTIDEIKANFSNYLQESQGETIVITENGRPIAALVVDSEELERLILANNPNFNQLLQTSERSIKETGGINSDDFWKVVEQSE